MSARCTAFHPEAPAPQTGGSQPDPGPGCCCRYLGGANLSGDFEHTQKTFLRQWPGEPGRSFRGTFASQSPSGSYFVICEGGGAEGSEGCDALKDTHRPVQSVSMRVVRGRFLALCGAGSAEFYVEACPVWERPRRVFDLRNTLTSFYLKAITPIAVNPGYRPHLFIANVANEPFAPKSVRASFPASAAASAASADGATNGGGWPC